MERLLDGLNVAQRTAVASDAAVLQVLAPPGSGKTKTLTTRIAFLITERQLQPWNIIVCTFTVKAASEMKDRIKSFVGEDISKHLKLGTFHSVALRYLKTYGQHIGLAKDFGIADTSDSKAILKRLVKRLGLSIDPGQALGRISSRKIKGSAPQPAKTPADVEQQEFTKLYEEYEATLAASNLLDYDDILLRCSFLLKSHPQCVSNVQAVLIDEFQDTNNIQYDLMVLFAQRWNVITIVGDPDQSIYGFRAAEIKNLTRMRVQWPDTITINLEENYRSSGAILNAAQKIIEQDESRPPKKLQATHTLGLRPVLRKLPSAYAEADWIVSEVRRIRTLSGEMIDFGDFSILLRSAALSRVIESALGNAGIPYRMVGGMRFYDRMEVKLVIDYLRVIHQPDNSEAVARIVNVPSRSVGEETVKRLREEATTKGVSLWKLILDSAQGQCNPRTKITTAARKGLESFVNVIIHGRTKVETWRSEKPSLVELINLVSQKIRLRSYLKSKFPEDSSDARWLNVEELTTQAAEVTSPQTLEKLIESDALPVLDDIEQRSETEQDVLSVFLANVALTASADKKNANGDENVQQITISTIHAAKGLEWPVVFIPACYNGSIPHSRADDNDEERRLLYVGMTRAKALLCLSCPIKNTQREETEISTFLTHSGVSSFFEEHGPSFSAGDVNNLSITLGKSCPPTTTLTQARSVLDRDEDNYWPLNGEEPPAELARWDRGKPTAATTGFTSARMHTSSAMHELSTASATIPVQKGFVSVASRYDELMEQAQLRKIDKRAVDHSQPQGADASSSRKRQVEGRGTIASFFSKRQRQPAMDEEASSASRNVQPVTRMPPQVQQEVSNTAEREKPGGVTTASHTLTSSHKPRSTPMGNRPGRSKPQERENQHRYILLSSSPTKPETAMSSGGQENVEPDAPGKEQPSTKAFSAFKPSSTLHTTSMDPSAPQRRTLGVRRSLQGWNARRT